MKRQQNNHALVQRIRALKADHPAWGYRRVWAYLKYRDQLPVNRKRIYRLMKDHDLPVKPNWRLKASRTGRCRKLCPNPQQTGLRTVAMECTCW